MSTPPGEQSRTPYDGSGRGPAEQPPPTPPTDLNGHRVPESDPRIGHRPGYRRGPEKNNLGIIAVVAGVAGLIGMFLPGVGAYLTLIAAVVAVVAGVLCIRATIRGQATNRALGITGLVLGVLELLVLGLAVVGLALWASATS